MRTAWKGRFLATFQRLHARHAPLGAGDAALGERQAAVRRATRAGARRELDTTAVSRPEQVASTLLDIVVGAAALTTQDREGNLQLALAAARRWPLDEGVTRCLVTALRLTGQSTTAAELFRVRTWSPHDAWAAAERWHLARATGDATAIEAAVTRMAGIDIDAARTFVSASPALPVFSGAV
jgi:hypothetical protein